MKIGAGIAGILLGIFSLLYVGIFGSMLGATFGFLSHFGPQNQPAPLWIQLESILSWLSPILAIAGGIVTFSKPRIGAIFLAVSALLHWYLLGTGFLGNLFALPIGVTAVLAFIASTSASKSQDTGTL